MLLPIRFEVEELIQKLINHLRFVCDNPKCMNLYVKTNALLLANFSRHVYGGNLHSDW